MLISSNNYEITANNVVFSVPFKKAILMLRIELSQCNYTVMYCLPQSI